MLSRQLTLEFWDEFWRAPFGPARWASSLHRLDRSLIRFWNLHRIPSYASALRQAAGQIEGYVSHGCYKIPKRGLRLVRYNLYMLL